MMKTKVTFLEGRLLSIQSKQYKKFSKSPDCKAVDSPEPVGAS